MVKYPGEQKRLASQWIKDYTGPDRTAKARGKDKNHVYVLLDSPHISSK